MLGAVVELFGTIAETLGDVVEVALGTILPIGKVEATSDILDLLG
jgi:hypothetical protein